MGNVTGFRWGVRAAGALGAAVTLIVPMLVFLGATARSASAEGGLRESATTTYVVDPSGAAVHVTVDLTTTNTTPDQHRGNVIEQAYFRGVLVVALAEATNFTAVSAGGAALSVTSQPASSPFVQAVEVQFSSNLFYNQTQTVHLHYDLPGGAPRSKSLTRVTSAFSSFDAWPVGDPGAANISIVVPRSFKVDMVGDDMSVEATGASVTYSANAIAEPRTWFVSVSARDDAKLVSKSIEADGNRIRIRAFPNDPAWSAFVDGRVAKGVPKLEALIGLPWPSADRLVITETVTPYLYGYAGWYTRHDNSIEIGDALDPQVILHEMSHMWFNDTLFGDRWIDEGFAQEYAARAVALMGGKLATPKAVDERAPGSVRLTDWSSVDLQNQISQAREAFGYNAAWFVIHRVTGEIGVARMRRVIAAAASHALPYQGTNNPRGAEDRSWHAFLDYLDEVGGSKQADHLFAAYVATSGDGDLAARTEARTAYTRLVGAGNGWKAPLGLRIAMSNWDFTTADLLLPLADAVTQSHDAIDHAVHPLGLRSPAKLQADYEYRNDDLDAVGREATSDLAAAKELVSASAAVHGHHGLFATIGLIGASGGSDLSGARRSFTAGNGGQSRREARAAEQVVADASGAGELRSGVALGVLVLVGLLVWRLRVRSRGRASADPDPGTGPEIERGTGPDVEPGSGAGVVPHSVRENGEVATGPAG